MMSQDEVKQVLQTMLTIMAALAAKTRTPADDLMVAILRANQDKLTQAVHALVQEEQPPSAERVAAVLAKVGIHV